MFEYEDHYSVLDACDIPYSNDSWKEREKWGKTYNALNLSYVRKTSTKWLNIVKSTKLYINLLKHNAIMAIFDSR